MGLSLLFQFVPTLSMFTTIRNPYVGRVGRSNAGYFGQKRSQSRSFQNYTQLKGQSRILQSTIAPVKFPDFPAQGAAVADSYFLKNIVSHHQSMVNVTDPLAILTNELFKINESGTISLVMDKNKISCLLTPEFFGVLRGAQDKGLLEDPVVIKQILQRGKSESITAGVAYSQEEMKKFIKVMNDVSKNKTHSQIAQSLEDAYLFLRANPNNSHDFTHYLLGLNTYSTILSDYQIQVFQSLPWSISGYESNEYRIFYEALSTIKTPKERLEYVKNNFSLAISAIIEEKRNTLLYCPKVEMSHVIYNNNPAFTTCGESAILDLIRNFFFDDVRRIFDPAGFFPHLTIKKELMDFFLKYNTPDTINTKSKDFDPQQDFVNLVSGIDGIKYVNNGYEISSMHNEENLIKFCNHFFSIKASNLSELGKKLSSDRRRMKFDLSSRDTIKEIAIKIDDKETSKTKHMYLYFQPGHSWFKAGDKQAQKVFFDTNTLMTEPNDPRNRSLLYVHPQPVLDNLFFGKIQKNMKDGESIFQGSLYYAFPARTEHEKGLVITAILLYSSKDQGALDYARYLFKSLSQDKQKKLKNDLYKWKALEKLENLSSIDNDLITLIE